MFRTSEKFAALAHFPTKTTITAKATTAKEQEDKGREKEKNKKSNFTEKTTNKSEK